MQGCKQSKNYCIIRPPCCLNRLIHIMVTAISFIPRLYDCVDEDQKMANMCCEGGNWFGGIRRLFILLLPLRDASSAYLFTLLIQFSGAMILFLSRKLRAQFVFSSYRRIRPLKLSVIGFATFGIFYFLFYIYRNDGKSQATSFNYGFTPQSKSLYPLPLLSHVVENHQFRTVKSYSHTSRNDMKPTRHTNFVALITTGVAHSSLLRLLDHMFIPYKITNVDKTGTSSLRYLLESSEPNGDGSRVGLLIFQDLALYLHLPTDLRFSIDEYCSTNDVGVVAFLNEGQAFSTEPNSITRVGHLPILIHRLQDIPWGLFVAQNTSTLRVTREGRVQPGFLDFETGSPRCCRATLVPLPGFDEYFVPLMFTRTAMNVAEELNPTVSPHRRTCVINSDEKNAVFQSLVLNDLGLHDGVRRILFSTSPDGLWINTMLLFDAVLHLYRGPIHASPPVIVPLGNLHQDFVRSTSHVAISPASENADLIRWILIDVDDVFLHGSGVSFTVHDATAMYAAQQHWRQHIPGFTFNLGFCGQFFERANETDRSGYEAILKHRHAFWWFDHLWNHLQPHKLNESNLLELMLRNKRFAELHDIPLLYEYAVAPHHSGVYPVVPDLYKAWRRAWNLSCTSTAHYPRLLTSGPHLGFQYAGIQVLPRQTCGIYSRFIHIGDFPGGETRLRELLFGGSLFYTILNNPVSIFMTHMTNYKGDRLALYLFDALFRFIRDWTNIRLISAPPTQLASLYKERFTSFGAQDLPLYSDPCRDRHDFAIWPRDWPCGPKALPSMLILGPQKTGSTALVHFLRLNPVLLANQYQFPTTFEELQFFSSDRIYARGLHWYLSQLNDSRPAQSATRSDERVRFEKSATYFASGKSPARIHALVPQVRLIVLLRDPVERAYSWYQHALAHRDVAAQLFSFMDLMRYGASITQSQLVTHVPSSHLQRLGVSQRNQTSMEETLTAVRHLYNRCVEPGYYAKHLTKWLSYFPASQILPIDSAQFNKAPDTVLHVVQEFLHLPTRINFSDYIEYNLQKGFHCLRDGFYFPEWPNSHLSPGRRCLGEGKGRPYRRLNYTTETLPLLRTLYLSANKQLLNMFRNQPTWRRWMSKASGHEYPSWLLNPFVTM